MLHLYPRKFIANAMYGEKHIVKLHPLRVRIISFGIRRSGSTFVYQCLADLFNNGVAKTHNYYQDNYRVRVLATIRDLRDCLVSLCRCYHPELTTIPEQTLRKYSNMITPSIKALQRYQKNHQCLTIRYEEFTTNTDLIFDTIEKLMEIDIPESRREQLCQAHSKERNKNLASKKQSFHNWDEQSQIHGHHIHEGTSQWQKYVEDPKIFDSLFGRALRDFGYVTS